MALTNNQIKNNFIPSNIQHRNNIETPAAEESREVKSDNQIVHLEFPYDDLELLYKYTLKKLGIKDPFK